jgi:hypothetical protein
MISPHVGNGEMPYRVIQGYIIIHCIDFAET